MGGNHNAVLPILVNKSEEKLMPLTYVSKTNFYVPDNRVL